MNRAAMKKSIVRRLHALNHNLVKQEVAERLRQEEDLRARTNKSLSGAKISGANVVRMFGLGLAVRKGSVRPSGRRPLPLLRLLARLRIDHAHVDFFPSNVSV